MNDGRKPKYLEKTLNNMLQTMPHTNLLSLTIQA